MGQQRHYKDLQLPQLRSFCLAAAEGNFTVAAERLGVSVSAVWQQVRALERQIGATLLRRRGRNVELTNEGRLLLDLLQPHFQALDSLGRIFKEQQGALPQTVTVAATEYFLTYNLPDCIARFTADFPKVRLNLRGEKPHAIRQCVEEGEADLGIMPYDRDAPRSSMLEYQDLCERDFMLVTSTKHPLARKRRVRPSDLVDYPVIWPPRGSYSHHMFERLVQRHGLSGRLHPLMESRNFGVVYHYASLGLGVSLLYIGPEVCRYLPNLCRRPLDEPVPRQPVALVRRKGMHVSAAVNRFREIVRASQGQGLHEAQ